MTFFRDTSFLFSLTIKMVMVYMLIEPRYSRKKNHLLACAMLAPIVLLNLILFVTLNAQQYTTLLFFFLTLPSIIIFWVLSKHRDARFIFTLCMVDTLAIEIGHITNIIDFYIPGDTYLFMFFPVWSFFRCFCFGSTKSSSLSIWTCNSIRKQAGGLSPLSACYSMYSLRLR